MLRNYPAVNGRAMFDLRWCEGGQYCPALKQQRVVRKLTTLGFSAISIDIAKEAATFIGTGTYELGASPASAPSIVDCSSFVQYLFARAGVSIPRASVDQREMGIPIGYEELLPGDLVFSTGPQNYYDRDPKSGVGHVGICVNEDRIIHASSGTPGISEATLREFFEGREKRGACRILPPPEYRLVIDVQGRDILWSRDLLRLIQRHLD